MLPLCSVCPLASADTVCMCAPNEWQCNAPSVPSPSTATGTVCPSSCYWQWYCHYVCTLPAPSFQCHSVCVPLLLLVVVLPLCMPPCQCNCVTCMPPCQCNEHLLPAAPWICFPQLLFCPATVSLLMFDSVLPCFCFGWLLFRLLLFHSVLPCYCFGLEVFICP